MLLQSGAHQLSIGVRGPAAAEQPAGRWTLWAPRRSSGHLSLEDQKEMVAMFTYSSQDDILVRRCDGSLKKKQKNSPLMNGFGTDGLLSRLTGFFRSQMNSLEVFSYKKRMFCCAPPFNNPHNNHLEPCASVASLRFKISNLLSLAELQQKAFLTGPQPVGFVLAVTKPGSDYCTLQV